MIPLPIAPGAAPATAPIGAEEATSASGDFAALLAMVAGVVPAPAPPREALPQATPEPGPVDTGAEPQGQTEITAAMVTAVLRDLCPAPASPSAPTPNPVPTAPVVGREIPVLAALPAPAQRPAAPEPLSAASAPLSAAPAPIPAGPAPIPAAASDAVSRAPAAVAAAPAVPTALAALPAEAVPTVATPPMDPVRSQPAVGPVPTPVDPSERQPEPTVEVSSRADSPAGPIGAADQSGPVPPSVAPAPSPRRHDKNDQNPTEPLPDVPVAMTAESRRSAEQLPIKTEVRSTPKVDSVGPSAPTPLLVAARAEVSEIADAPTTTPVVPPAVHDQIVSAVVPLHGRGDGRHEVTLELRPDDLGVIRVEVTVENNTVHLTLHAAESATGRLLSAALPELRSALAEAGLTAGQVGVGPDGGGGADQRRPSAAGDNPTGRPARSGQAGTSADTGPDPVRIIRPAAAGRLDFFL